MQISMANSGYPMTILYSDVEPLSEYCPVMLLLSPATRILNPLIPKIKIWILICCPYSFPTEVVGRSW